MRTAVSLPPFTDAATVVALAAEAEQAGWDGVFLWDHLVFVRQLRARPVGHAGHAPGAQRWDGIVPLGPQGPTSPDELATYLQGVESPPGWDVVAGWAPGVPADEYAAAGATWLVDSVWPEGDWLADIRARVTAGP